MKMTNLAILGICICALLCSAGCVTMAKNLMKPQLAPELIPVPNPEPTPIPITEFNVSIPIVYVEGQDDFMFRTNGYWLGDWVQYKRDNVEGLKDIDLRATVYRALFLPNYRYWSVSWGEYQWQIPNPGMKYLAVFAHIRMEGTTQESDPRMWGPGQDHFRIQIGNETYEPDTNHVIGYRIKELEEQFDLLKVNRIFDYGYYRYFSRDGTEMAGELGYIRMGRSNAWDGYLLFEVPREARMEDIRILEQIDGLGSVWWYAIPKPLS